MVKSSTTGADAGVKKAAGPRTAAPKAGAAKGAPKAGAAKARPAPKSAPAGAAAAAAAGGAVRKKDFVERVLDAAGAVNKAQAKAVVDHVLAELGAAIAKGESLILPPLGKLKVAKRTEKDGAGHATVKVKTSAASADKANKGAKPAADQAAGEKDEKSV